MRFLYICVAYLISPVWIGVLALRGFRDRHHWRGFSERFGFGTKVLTRSIWVHAVSVGEVLAARPVLAELRKRYPQLRLFLSTTTLSGQQLARQSVPDVDGTFYLPFDWTFTVRRTLRVVRPRLFPS